MIEQLIPEGHPNRPGIKLEDFVGVIIHRTGRDVGAAWLGRYFAREPRQAIVDNETYGSSQLGIDDEGVFLYVPLTEVAWGCSANGRNFHDIHIENCQYYDDPPRIRPKTYARLVATSARICLDKGWSGPREEIPEEYQRGRRRFRRHQDEDPTNRPNDTGDYLRWDDFLDDVERAMAGTPWLPKEDDMDEETVKRLVREVLNEDGYPNFVHDASERLAIDAHHGHHVTMSINDTPLWLSCGEPVANPST